MTHQRSLGPRFTAIRLMRLLSCGFAEISWSTCINASLGDTSVGPCAFFLVTGTHDLPKFGKDATTF